MHAQNEEPAIASHPAHNDSRAVALASLTAPDSGRAAERLRILYEASKLLSSTLSSSEIYDRLRELVAREMLCDGMIVSSYNADEGLIRCEYVWVKGVVTDPSAFPPLPIGPEGTGMQTQVLRTGEPVLFSDVRERVKDDRGVFYDMGPDGELRPAAPESDNPQTRTALMVPVKRDERTIGVLQVMSDEPNAYSWDDLALLEALITQMTVAIHNAALYAEARKQIEERAAAEARLRESGEMLRVAMRGGRMGAWSRDLADNSVAWSPELEDLFGVEPGGFGGSEAAFFDLMHPDDRAAAAKEIAAAIEAGRDYGIEFRFRHASGDWRWMEGRGRAVYDASGRPTRLYGIGIDVTERKRQQAEIVELNASLQRAMSESHHRIKNNLQVLSALVQVQIDDGQPMVSRSAMERLSAHVRSLAALHELLTVKFSGGDADIVSLRELIDKLTPLLRAAAGDREIVVDAAEVHAPLRQAGSFSMLVNELVSNAVKHGRGRIAVSLRLDKPGAALLVVTDEGPGLPPDFDPLTSANTGIELITTLGTWDLAGRVQWLRAPDGGAMVTVRFPVEPQAP